MGKPGNRGSMASEPRHSGQEMLGTERRTHGRGGRGRSGREFSWSFLDQTSNSWHLHGSGTGQLPDLMVCVSVSVRSRVAAT